jgi:hypothetical protein
VPPCASEARRVAAKRVADGISLFLSLREGKWGDQPWTFTRRFAAAYCGLSEDIARLGIKELRTLGVIELVDELELGGSVARTSGA